MVVLFCIFVGVFLLRGYDAENGSGEGTIDESQVKDLEQNTTFQCPYIFKCSYDHNESLTTSNDDDSNRPCCRPCGTTQNFKMECCPDIVPCTLPSATPSIAERVCVPGFYARYDKYIEHGILVIATCKDGSDNRERTLCLQKYDINTASPFDMVPVTDFKTFKLYRNVHCALCNGVETTDIKYWLPNVLCSRSYYMASFNKILKSCDIKYSNPYPDIPTPRCNYNINSCNVTGLSVFKFGSSYKQQCEQTPDNSSSYVQYLNMIFKNSDCMSCNDLVPGGRSFVEPSRSFSVMFGVDALRMYNTKTSAACSSGMVFIRQKGSCSDARCSVLRHLHDSSCKKQVHQVESFTYNIILRIKTDAQLELSTAYGLAKQIYELVDDLLHSVFNSITGVRYKAVIIANTRFHDEITKTDILSANLLWFEIQTRLMIKTTHNPEEYLKSLISKGTRFPLHINGIVSYITLMVKDGVYSDHENRRFVYCISKFMFDPCLDFDIPSFSKALTGRDNFTLVPLYGNYVHFHEFYVPNILEYRDCVFVPVKKIDTPWQYTDYGLQFTRTGLLLSFSEFVYGENGDLIWVCLETYYGQQNYGPRALPIVYIYLLTPLLQYWSLLIN